ncbi:hypothetical protein HPB50_002051 [Hyalomma asiaticum]|uniref:Uncharacterized protein n=1 Tax=Hyalomma asiaticum TaxID=266040 RepID=A0ACB7TAI6_HYAAI|nr:hypothetical protein HPB50_002051 [Hyalomma asiaticum]
MLCEDCVWGVRKACADVFMPVSCVCTLATRRNSLAPLFLNLLDDQSRWVRIAAYQALGPFISTFANPARTGLYCSEDGVVSVRTPEDRLDAFIEGEVPSAADSPALLTPSGKKSGLLEDTHTSDFSLTGTVGLPGTDTVHFEERVSAAIAVRGKHDLRFGVESNLVRRAAPSAPLSCTAAGAESTASASLGATDSVVVTLPDRAPKPAVVSVDGSDVLFFFVSRFRRVLPNL